MLYLFPVNHFLSTGRQLQVGQSGKSQVFLFPSVKSALLWKDWMVDKVQRNSMVLPVAKLVTDMFE